MSEKQTSSKMTPQEAAKTLFKVLNGASSIKKDDYPRFVNALLYALHATTGDGKPATHDYENIKYGLFDCNFGFKIGKSQYLVMLYFRSNTTYVTMINNATGQFVDKSIRRGGLVTDCEDEIEEDVENDYRKIPRLRPLVRKLIALINVVGLDMSKGRGRDDDETMVNKRPVTRMTVEIPVFTDAVSHIEISE